MGTRGYRVYRYKGFYFVIYNHSDSYPSCLGEIQDKYDESEDEDLEITNQPPKNDLFIEWMYEIDLDNYIFYVDGEPLFDLRHMPYGRNFVSCIGYNNYGRRSFHRITPERYRYKLPPPPAVEPATLDAYKAYNVTCASPHDVLRIPLEKRAVEQTRIEIMQVVIAAAMGTMNNSNGLGINAVLSDTVATAISTRIENICRIFSGPLVFPESYPLTWLLERLRSIDAETTLQAAIVELAGQAKSRLEDRGVVSLKKLKHELCRLSHSPPLQLLPSDHSTNPSTPGIEALARLGQMVFERSMEKMFAARNTIYFESPSDSTIATLPTEICISIGQHLSPGALLDFAATFAHECFHLKKDGIPAGLDLTGKSVYASSFSAVANDGQTRKDVTLVLYSDFENGTGFVVRQGDT
ncbi:hypothetical protein BT96DRAFT_1013282 [Gymnopus androsaceus JB14]|uniref:Uncharacterized protein n=1 Tax=Gymnopus androsaceus JB14 TaxID=1447944 RepID=A0A6A4IFZ2_9AGAR|nr:hypothetical protein BT96DRAFT_1013282 [Gymnopus androsaceus JB14]